MAFFASVSTPCTVVTACPVLPSAASNSASAMRTSGEFVIVRAFASAACAPVKSRLRPNNSASCNCSSRFFGSSADRS